VTRYGLTAFPAFQYRTEANCTRCQQKVVGDFEEWGSYQRVPPALSISFQIIDGEQSIPRPPALPGSVYHICSPQAKSPNQLAEEKELPILGTIIAACIGKI
jgi:hypothetical protein